MAQTYPTSFKNCSTCITWEGKRNVNSTEKTVNVGSPSSKGACVYYKGQDKMAFMACEKWSAV